MALAAGQGEQIRLRAEQVRDGDYVGMFEWLAWAAMKKARVLMMFGSAQVDVTEIFGHGMPEFSGGYHCVHRVAAVHSKDGRWLSATVRGGAIPKVNHYVIGVTATAEERGAAPQEPKGGVALAAGARKAAMDGGWMLKATESTGNCAFDAMAYHTHQVREPATWQSIRDVVADYMIEVSDRKEWQVAWCACCENAQAVPGGKAAPGGPKGKGMAPPKKKPRLELHSGKGPDVVVRGGMGPAEEDDSAPDVSEASRPPEASEASRPLANALGASEASRSSAGGSQPSEGGCRPAQAANPLQLGSRLSRRRSRERRRLRIRASKKWSWNGANLWPLGAWLIRRGRRGGVII